MRLMTKGSRKADDRLMKIIIDLGRMQKPGRISGPLTK
jgi:hypothetical protein